MLIPPLVGEPLALELVNTRWVESGQWVDLFDEPEGMDRWMTSSGIADTSDTSDEALREARAALREVLDRPGDEPEARLNRVLARGAVIPVLRRGAPGDEIVVDAGWRVAWEAAQNLLTLLGTQPDRVRQCAHPDCVLYFFDVSRNGTRRWCSMDTCGARFKAARHYKRLQAQRTDREDTARSSAHPDRDAQAARAAEASPMDAHAT